MGQREIHNGGYVPTREDPVLLYAFIKPNGQHEKRAEELLNMANNWTPKEEHAFLLCQHPRFPALYMLPKVHKNLENPLGRSIISGNDTITEPVSKFVDYFIKPFVAKLPSYIQDSTCAK